MREVRTLEICSIDLSVDAIIIKKPSHMAYDVLLQTHTQSPDLFDQHLDVISILHSPSLFFSFVSQLDESLKDGLIFELFFFSDLRG